MNTNNFNRSWYSQIRKALKFAFLLWIVILTYSCKKYLDVKSSSKETIPATLADCQQLLDNTNVTNGNYPEDGEASSDDMDAGPYFQYLPKAYLEIFQWLPTAMHLGFPNVTSYFNPYQSILNANLVLETYEKLSDNDKASVLGQNLKGAALFIRANYFYEVAQLYAKPYNSTTANQDLGIPLRLSASITENLTRGTVQQTYDRIINDLNVSIDLLPSTSIYTSRPTKAAAYAQLARVYLSKGDYANALTSANACLSINSTLIDYNTLNPSTYNAFTTFPKSNNEVIFHGQSTSTFSYFAIIAKDLSPMYDSTDLRLRLFFRSDGAGNFTFKGSYGGSALFTGLATDEMYLIRSECAARAGNTVDALKDLNTLLINRYKTGTFVPVAASNPDVALSKILTERRKELVFRGTRWTDLRRLNMDPRFATTLTRIVSGIVYTLPPNDLRYTLLFPADVIQYGGYPQNPR